MIVVDIAGVKDISVIVSAIGDGHIMAAILRTDRLTKSVKVSKVFHEKMVDIKILSLVQLETGMTYD